MNVAQLNIHGTDAELDRLLRESGLTADGRWRAGDRIIGARTHDSSGIEFDLANTATPAALVPALRTVLHDWAAKGLSLSGYDVRGLLSLGVTVGDSSQFMATVVFDAEDMLMLGGLGIAVSVSAYPTSDDANEPD